MNDALCFAPNARGPPWPIRVQADSKGGGVVKVGGGEMCTEDISTGMSADYCLRAAHSES